ncbi:uncharacterized protein LOC116617902 [Nematostella vectensis]|uniref:Gustatory receptor-like 2 n=1 Tax=Nematostella vectensis TaxID=45351 RepID=A0A0C5GWD8_NEMVE|nr:uncharacterized protein LOC116617902 [Nematostella vectensis]XP_048576287.1 uncharacterized protein LOC116617902 [Nematostella vectensis]AJP16416.1 gustatory receptor-like 2 [Nematostella vectensis]
MSTIESNTLPCESVDVDNRQKSLRQVEKTFRPVTVAMKFLGLYFGNPYSGVDLKENAVAPLNENCARTRVSWKEKFGKTYCLLVSLLLYAGFACSLSFTVRGVSYSFVARRLTMDIWMLWCALQGTVCILSISRRKNGSKFSSFIRALACADSNGFPPPSKLPKVIITISIATVIFNNVLFMVLLHYSGVSSSFLFVLFGNENMTLAGPDGWVIAVYQVTLPFATSAWAFPSCFYMVTCIIVADRFSFLTKKAQDEFKSTNHINMKQLRRDHLRLCHALEKLDEIISPLALISYGCSIPEICIALDVTIRMSREGYSIFIISVIIFWSLINISNTIVTSLAGAHINSTAHSLTSVVYDIDVDELKDGEKTELMLLLNKLNTEVISPTIGGIVPVTRGMLLTVFGTIIGYLTILVQFK